MLNNVPLPPPIAFTLDEAQKAGEKWRFNCGPGALCAVLGLTPTEIRPLMGDFEKKGYTNPPLMSQVLARCGAAYRKIYRGDSPGVAIPEMNCGLVRVQWAGPWSEPGVPMPARYRHTHWVAVRKQTAEVFDINAMCVGGWLPYNEWAYQLVPWLIRECCPKGSGGWWPTHALEVRIQSGTKPVAT